MVCERSIRVLNEGSENGSVWGRAGRTPVKPQLQPGGTVPIFFTIFPRTYNTSIT